MSIEFDTIEEKLVLKGLGHHCCSVSLHLFKLAFEEYVPAPQDVLMDEEIGVAGKKEEAHLGLSEQFVLFLNNIGAKSQISSQFFTEYEDNKFTFEYKIDTLNMIFEMGYNEVVFSVDLTNPDTHLKLCQELQKILDYLVNSVDSGDDDDL